MCVAWPECVSVLCDLLYEVSRTDIDEHAFDVGERARNVHRRRQRDHDALVLVLRSDVLQCFQRLSVLRMRQFEVSVVLRNGLHILRQRLTKLRQVRRRKLHHINDGCDTRKNNTVQHKEENK